MVAAASVSIQAHSYAVADSRYSFEWCKPFFFRELTSDFQRQNLKQKLLLVHELLLHSDIEHGLLKTCKARGQTVTVAAAIEEEEHFAQFCRSVADDVVNVRKLASNFLDQWFAKVKSA